MLSIVDFLYLNQIKQPQTLNHACLVMVLRYKKSYIIMSLIFLQVVTYQLLFLGYHPNRICEAN